MPGSDAGLLRWDAVTDPAFSEFLNSTQPQQSPPPPPPAPPAPAAPPAPSAPPPPPPTPPDPWMRTPEYAAPRGIKQADPDIVLFNDEPIDPEFLITLGYEDISGMELINISRSDIVNGSNVVYSPIKNLSSLRRKYNPNNIISMPEISNSFFSRFSIDLILRGIKKPYFDEDGNLVIEIDNVRQDEDLEIEIIRSGRIDEVEFL